ncbi:MAG: glycosyltransferase family 4 protein, partial [Candidatus Dojkabacteria bacterium]
FNHWKNYIEVEKISRIYNGIKTDGYNELVSNLRNELHLTLDDVIILMVGRINHWKGQSYFLDIAHELAEKFLNVKFVMVGDPYQGNEHLLNDLNEKIIKLNLTYQVINLGYRTDIQNILKGSDIFISPSILPDPFPTVVLEAMAAGLPVIATAHGGPKEMVEDKITGFLIPINDAKKATSCFIELIESKKLRIEMGHAGSNRLAQLFSLKSFERNLLEAIK